jgi:hypothetical protein
MIYYLWLWLWLFNSWAQSQSFNLIAIFVESSAVLVDVETGELTHSHEVKDLCSGHWKSTQYEASLKDVSLKLVPYLN